MGEPKCCDAYPWHLLMRSLALLLSFLVYGINYNLFGPTLLDLKDLVGATVGDMSIVIVIWAFGSILGSFAVGLLMDRFTRFFL